MQRPERPPRTRFSAEAAETIALQALGFLATDAERAQRLLDLTGLSPQELRASAADPSLLAGILDYLLSHEPLLLEFAESADLQPEDVVGARRNLPGGFDAA